MIRTIVLAAALVVPGIAFASPSPAEAPRSSVVRYADLNLSTNEGIERLMTRIKQAGKQVCDYGNGFTDLTGRQHERRCYKTAVDNAVRQINNPVLTARHFGPQDPQVAMAGDR